jgi:hypothetical protein
VTRCAALLGSFAISIACAIGEGGTDRPSSTIADDSGSSTGASASTSGAETAADDGSTPCVPGQQIACPCPGGSEGAQACNAAGTGYEPCMCPDPDSETSSGASTDTTTAASADTIGPDECVMDDDTCDSCVLCGIEGPCSDLYNECAGTELCSEAVNCVIMCGFSEICVSKCAPKPDSLRGELFNQLTECLRGVCPQCVQD